MKRKKLLAAICAASLLMSNASLTSLANNSSDTEFDFNFNYLATVCVTEGREKEDASSSYIKASQLPSGGMEVRISGAYTKYKDLWHNVTVNNAWISETGVGRFIQQLVYENGYSYARLEGRKSNQTQDAAGVWSPDSVGNYPILNNTN